MFPYPQRRLRANQVRRAGPQDMLAVLQSVLDGIVPATPGRTPGPGPQPAQRANDPPVFPLPADLRSHGGYTVSPNARPMIGPDGVPSFNWLLDALSKPDALVGIWPRPGYTPSRRELPDPRQSIWPRPGYTPPPGGRF